MKKLLLLPLLLFISNLTYGLESVSVVDVKPIPSKVVENTTVTQIQYKIHNNSAASTFTIGFTNLRGNGIDFTTTCGQLAPDADCNLNLTFSVPALPSGATSFPYSHTFYVTGAPTSTPYLLKSTIVAGSPNVTPDLVIALNDPAVTVAGTPFDVFLEQLPSGQSYEFPDLELGTTTAFESIVPGQYDADITPATVTGSDTQTYDKPQDFHVNISATGQKVTFTYTSNANTDVSTNITAPNLPASPGTLDIILKSDTKTYEHAQAPGTSEFERIPPGQYTLTAPSYVGTDTFTYVADVTNPKTITGSSQTLAITYTAKPPATEHVSTNITAPELAASQTVNVSCENASNTYAHDQPAGIHTFDNMADGSYTCTAADYTVGADTYEAVPTNPYVVDSGNTTIAIPYQKEIPPSGQYDWHTSHLSDIVAANINSIWWGGGSTTGLIQISTNPPVNPWLDAKALAYEAATLPIQATAAVQGLPNYLGMATIGEPTTGTTEALKLIKSDGVFHYEGDGAGNPGCYWDETTAPCSTNPPNPTYTPQVDYFAGMANEVKTANSHDLVPGLVFYTINYSNGSVTIDPDTLNDDNVTKHFYNLMYEVYRMEHWYSQTPSRRFVLFLNPDTTYVFNTCSLSYCPIMYRNKISNDSSDKILQNPMIAADLDAAIDRMVSKGYFTSGEAATLKSGATSALAIIPNMGRTAPGLPEITQVTNYLIKTIAPHVAFGYGMNAYDNNNPMMNVGTPPVTGAPWETGSFDWLHKINHIGLTTEQRTAAIQFEADKFAKYIKEMQFVGGYGTSTYKPDFIYFDRFERDVIPGEVGAGFLMNGVDLDTYLQYLKDVDADLDDEPLMLWQMPGATLQTEGETFSGVLADTVGTWAFGNATLNNDFSNIAASLNLSGQAITSSQQQITYYTSNLKSAVDNVEKYLELGSGAE